jgi:hypothetical protein
MRADLLRIGQVCIYWTLALLCAMSAPLTHAEQAVYRCGQEITNHPPDSTKCQKLEISGRTQIEGTRVQPAPKESAPLGTSEAPLTRASVPKFDSQDMQQRNAQARTILDDELLKLNAKHAELVRTYNQGRPALLPGETPIQTSYIERVAALKSNVQRMERDIQALARELSRYPQNSLSVKSLNSRKD